MKRKLLRVLLILVCAALVLTGAAAGLSRAVWGRSLLASVYERILFRRFANDRTAEEEVARLEALRKDGERAYVLPQKTPFDVAIGQQQIGGTDCFVMNSRPDAALTVFYLHGGAFINNFNAYHWRLLNRLARDADCEIIAPVYHISPFGNCERAYPEMTAVYEACVSARPGRPFALMGDSAGGGLALGLAQHFVSSGVPLPARLILYSPWVDLSMDNPDIAEYLSVEPVLHFDLVKVHGRYWADGLDLHDPRVSPLFGEMKGLPPVTLYTGTRELLYPDLVLLNDALTAGGVPVDLHVGKGLNHEYPLMPIPEGRRAVRDTVALLRALKKA